MTIKIQSLKKGDTFFECDYGINVEYVATCDPYRAENDQGWAIDGQTLQGADTHFYVCDAYPAYAPKLYPMPEYN